MRNSVGRTPSFEGRSLQGSNSRINKSTSSSRSGSDSRRSVDETSELGYTSIPLDTPVSCLALNSDSSQIIVGGRNLLKIFDAEAEEFVELVNLRVGLQQGNQQHCNPADVAWSPHHDNYVVSTGYNGAVVVWDLNRVGCHKQEYVFVAHPRMVNRLLFHPTDPNLLMTGSQDGFMKLYDIRVRTLRCTLNGNTNSGIRDIQFDPFSDNVYAAAYDSGVVQLWDVRYPSKWERHYLAHNGPVLSLDWHRSEQHWLATGGRDKLISVWDMRASQRLTALYSVQTIGGVVKVRWRPRHKYHICSSALLTDYGVNTWDLQRPYAPVTSFSRHRDLIAGICFRNDDPEVFYTAGRDGLMVRYVYSRPTYRPQKSFNPVVVDVGVHGCLLHAGHDELIASTAPQKTQTGGSKLAPHRLPGYFRRTAEESNDSKVLVLSLLSHFSNVECLSMDSFLKMAKGYKLAGRPVPDLCKHNADVAASINLPRIAESWRMLEVMFTATSIDSQLSDTGALLPVPISVDFSSQISQTPDTASPQIFPDTPHSATAINENPFLAQMEKSRTVSISDRKRLISLQEGSLTQQSTSVPTCIADESSGARQTKQQSLARKVSLTTGRLTSKTSSEFNAGLTNYVVEKSVPSKFSTGQLKTSSSFHDALATRSFQISRSPTADTITVTQFRAERSKLKGVGAASVSQPSTPGSAMPKFIASSVSNKTVPSGNRSQRPDLEPEKLPSLTGDFTTWPQDGFPAGQRAGKTSSLQGRSRTGTLEKDSRTAPARATVLAQRRKLGLASLDTQSSASVLSLQLAAKSGVPRELGRVKEQEKSLSLPINQSVSAKSSISNVENTVARVGDLTHTENVAADEYRMIDCGKLVKINSNWLSGPGFYSNANNLRTRGYLLSGGSEDLYNSDDSMDYSDYLDDDNSESYSDDDNDDCKSNDENSTSNSDEGDEIESGYKSVKQYEGFSSSQHRRNKTSSVKNLINTSPDQALLGYSTIPGDHWLEFGPAFCSFFSNLDRYNELLSPKKDGFEECLRALSTLTDVVQQEEEVLSRKGSGASSLEPLAPSRHPSISREGSPAAFDCTLVPSGGATKYPDATTSSAIRVPGGHGYSNDGAGSSTNSDSGGGVNQSSKSALKINSAATNSAPNSVELTVEGYSDELVTLRQDILQTPSFLMFMKTWDCNAIITEMLEYYADQNDVQTAVSMVIVLGEIISRLSISEKQLEQWFFSYIDLLSKMELWKEATEVINLSCVSEVNQLTLTSTQIYTFCSRCNKPLLKAGWTCQRCNQYIHKCCLCHLPVKGLYIWCQGCAHGGHPAHMRDWFSTHRQCPTGCGHECEYM